LVIGGGIAGMTASLGIANMGFNVHLIEREKELGGMLRRINKLFPLDVPAEQIISSKVDDVEKNDKIEVHRGTEIKDVAGYVGNYNVTTEENGSEKIINAGAIVVATGSKEIDATGLYGYGEYKNVITQLELEQMLRKGEMKEPKSVVMVNCVGAREDEGRTYCCRIGCGTSLKNAKLLKESYPNAIIAILYQDMVVFGKEEEEYYTDVKGVRFIRYSSERKPVIQEKDGELIVKVYNQLLGKEIEIGADSVVLTIPTEGADGSEELQRMLKVSLGVGNFFTEVHPKIRPLDFVIDGVYLCGAAHYPKGVTDVIAQAEGVASRVATILSKDKIEAEATIAYIDEILCRGCGRCKEVCEYDAIRLEEREPEVLIGHVNEVLCKGCGVCSVACPNGAITARHFTSDQIVSMIAATLDRSSFGQRPKMEA
jgi:heterodisulfide reductase subunit A